MRNALRFASIATVLIAIAWLALRDDERVDSSQETPSAPPEMVSASESPIAPVAAATETSRVDFEPVKPVDAGPSARAEFSDGHLRVRAEDRSGTGIPGATVLAFDLDPRSAWTVESARSEDARAAARTDGQGECAISLESRRTYSVVVIADGFARAAQHNALPGGEIVFRLSTGGSVTGRVVRAEDGVGIAGATVRLYPSERGENASPRAWARVAATDPAGEFYFERVIPGEYFVEPTAIGYAWGLGKAVDVGDGGVSRIEIALSEGATVKGMVIDRVTKFPIADAQVGDRIGEGRFAKTNLDGTFQFEGFTWIDLHARKRGYAANAVRIRDRESEPLPDFVTIELAPGRAVTGRVTDRKEAPVADVTVIAVSFAHLDPTQRLEWIETKTDERGQYSLEGLDPGLRHILLVRKRGYGSSIYDFPNSELSNPIVEFPTIQLLSAGSISGRVVDQDGKPLSDIPVEIEGNNNDRRRFGVIDLVLADRLQLAISRADTRTDRLGRFSFTDLPEGAHLLRHRFPAAHTSIETLVHLDAEEHRDDIRLFLDAGVTIAGVVETVDGGRLPTVYLSVDSENGGRSTDVHVQADGSFCARGLSKGMYTISLYPYGNEPGVRTESVYQQHKIEHVAGGTTGLRIRLERKPIEDAPRKDKPR